MPGMGDRIGYELQKLAGGVSNSSFLVPSLPAEKLIILNLVAKSPSSRSREHARAKVQRLDWWEHTG